MAGVRITIDHNAPQIGEALAVLSTRMDNLTPAMRLISHVLVDQAEEAFAQQQDASSGLPWAPLKPSTIEQRSEQGYWPGAILQRRGRLAASIVPAHGQDFAAAGTNVVYAAVMHFGARKGEFGADRHGRPLPWGDIPARRILGLSEVGAGDILDIIAAHVLDGA